MSLSRSRYRARSTVRVAVAGAPPPPARFFGKRSLALVAGGAVGGVLAMSGAVVTGALVGVGSLIAAPFLR